MILTYLVENIVANGGAARKVPLSPVLGRSALQGSGLKDPEASSPIWRTMYPTDLRPSPNLIQINHRSTFLPQRLGHLLVHEIWYPLMLVNP